MIVDYDSINYILLLCVFFCTQDSVTFVRTSVKEVITSLDSNLTCSLLKLMDCFFSPFNIKEVCVLYVNFCANMQFEAAKTFVVSFICFYMEIFVLLCSTSYFKTAILFKSMYYYHI